ncbi:TetR/AcrR family transcriptional regulator [Ancylobacter pratisalsi]|uniref:TetR/AcrR family transcriptional regulator n=1 Tax=Ancylobacter pratisalsi TaxID=1745854 RepID=A0A6P1YRP2_9HYPH|nr:TetR/AcrR family transcriptional regulator [Ancylobacter pratisalsi]QIB35376.1 TetR/AcrR family transcriptional regulator [Ancylobacter pratisalsi]
MNSTVRSMPANAPGRSEAEPAKRREIIDGARRVFFDKGFDGASMDEVARVAGVSKATIYVYFDSKEDLFAALVELDRARSAEHLFEVGEGDADAASVLRRIGISFMSMMVRPDHIRLVRMVIGVAEKFPHIGQTFFNDGPCLGGRRLAELLQRQSAAGALAIDDHEAAAFQFLNLCQGNIVKGLMFGGEQILTPELIEKTVDDAVKVFLAAYGTAGRRA